jgi:hypothetical protein
MKLDYKVNKSWRQVCSISFDNEYISNNRSRSECYMDRSPRQRRLTSKIYTTCIVERMHMPASNHAAGIEHLSGAFHHWQMVIELRDYLFQVCWQYTFSLLYLKR